MIEIQEITKQSCRYLLSLCGNPENGIFLRAAMSEMTSPFPKRQILSEFNKEIHSEVFFFGHNIFLLQSHSRTCKPAEFIQWCNYTDSKQHTLGRVGWLLVRKCGRRACRVLRFTFFFSSDISYLTQASQKKKKKET